MITEKGETTTSYLLIQDATVSDSGNYNCAPSNADVASVRVHVLNGMHLISIWVIIYHALQNIISKVHIYFMIIL